MATTRPRIGIPVDVKSLQGEPVHAVGEKYVAAVAHGAGGIPLLLPALGAGAEIDSLEGLIEPADMLEGLDGLLLTGSPSNLAPSYYGSEDEGVGPFDPQRDGTTLALLRAALARDLPVLAVCRGLQELNVVCGGTLYVAVHEQAGYLDHRYDHTLPRAARYRPAHKVELSEDGVLAGFAGSREITVNSLHGQAIARLGRDLAAEAVAPDGLVEAVCLPERSFVVGVQWHPEWDFADNHVSHALFAAFGEAARAYQGS